MKAILLSAGKGDRLKEITQTIPKPMLEYKEKPILLYNIELCKSYGITDIFINTHHLAHVIKDYFGNGSAHGVHITYSYEPKLLGTAGALNNFRDDLNEPFFVIYGDNYSHFPLDQMIAQYESQNMIASIAFHYREDVGHSGVAEFDHNGRIQRFLEKPAPNETESHWVNAGIYFCSPSILSFIPEGFSDFGKDIFPALIKSGEPAYGVCLETEVRSFDTIEMYKENI